MDHIYEKVKANSKFFKIIKEYSNGGGQPTSPGANPGANPGTAPTQTQPVDPKLLDANKKAALAAKVAAQARLTAILATRTANKNSQSDQDAEIKQLQATIASKTL